MDSPSIFARLPNEVLHEVLTHAAASDRATALALTLVASWVRHLVEPVLYHTVVLSTARGVTAFLGALSHKPDSFGTAHVKHLGIFAPGPADAIDKVIDACKGVDSLACGVSLPAQPRQPHQHQLHKDAPAECPREQHLLGLACRDGWDVRLVGPTVTHLRVHLASPQRLPGHVPTPPPQDGDGGGAKLDATNLDSLAYLPSLTHLGIVYRPTKARPATALLPALKRLLSPSSDTRSSASAAASDNDAGAATARPKKLALVLVQVLGTRAAQGAAVDALNKAALAEGGDAVRIVAERAPGSAVCQWEDSVREGRSVWDQAEAVVRQRLAAQKQAQQHQPQPQLQQQ